MNPSAQYIPWLPQLIHSKLNSSYFLSLRKNSAPSILCNWYHHQYNFSSNYFTIHFQTFIWSQLFFLRNIFSVSLTTFLACSIAEWFWWSPWLVTLQFTTVFPTRSIICLKADVTMPLSWVTLYSLTVSFLPYQGSFIYGLAQAFVKHYRINTKEFHLDGV